MSNVSQVFSFGEKQLIFLAIGQSFRKEILVLDEATASIDQKTDEFI